MKFKQFKKEVYNNSDLLKLSGKDLSVMFNINILKAKYFKKRFKQELQYALDDYISSQFNISLIND